jgi:hypothetical protein
MNTWLMRHPYFTAISLFVVLHGGIIAFSGLNRPIMGDEGHFIATINLFAQNWSWETIRTYNEMSTPLPFMLYAQWGKLFGLEVASLRVLSLLIGFTGALLFFTVARRLIVQHRFVIFAYLLFLFQPYLIGFTMYVYTDMFAIAGLLIAFWGAIQRNHWLLVVGLVLALLSRQYAIFFVMTLILFYFYEYFAARKRDTLVLLLATLFSGLPLSFLFWYWQGMAPDNEMRSIYLTSPATFHLTSLVLYVSCITIYLFPAIFLRMRTLLMNKKIWIIALVLSAIYLLAPIRASQAALNVDIETVGLFHRLIRSVCANQLLVDTVFYLCFLIGLIVLIHCVHILWLNWKNRRNDVENILMLSMICFLIVMPFSYLHWEKYFTLLLPFLLIALLRERNAYNTDLSAAGRLG